MMAPAVSGIAPSQRERGSKSGATGGAPQRPVPKAGPAPRSRATVAGETAAGRTVSARRSREPAGPRHATTDGGVRVEKELLHRMRLAPGPGPGAGPAPGRG